MIDEPYEEWLAKGRTISPPPTLVDRIMSQVAIMDRQRRGIWWLRLIQSIEQSRIACWAVCAGALVIGGTPFFYLAYVAQFLTF